MLGLCRVVNINDKIFTNIESLEVTKNSRALIDVAKITLIFNDRLEVITKDLFKTGLYVQIFTGYKELSGTKPQFKKWCVAETPPHKKITEFYDGRTVKKAEGLDLYGGSKKVFEGVISESTFDENTVTIMVRSKIWLLQKAYLPEQVIIDKKGFNLIDEVLNTPLKKLNYTLKVDPLVAGFLRFKSYVINSGTSVFDVLNDIFYATQANIYFKGDTLYIQGAYVPYKEDGLKKFSSILEEGHYPYEEFNLDETIDLKRRIKLVIDNGDRSLSVGNNNAKTETVNLPSGQIIDDNTKQYATKIMNLRSQKDNKSTLYIWLHPFIEPSDYVLVKKYYIRRSNEYTAEKLYTNPSETIHYVTGVTTRVSANGDFQILTLENKIDEQ